MEVTILNGKKWSTMNWNERRRARHNPDESFVARTGPMVLAAAVAAPLAVVADRTLAGLKKADGSRRFTDNQVAGMVAGLGVAGAVVSQVNEMAPRVGAAVGAAFGALAVRRAYDARSIVQAAPQQAPQQALPAPAPAPALPQGTTPSPTQVTAAQTASPSTPAIPQGAPAPTAASSTEVARSGAIIRRAGAAYDATYGQVSRSGAPVTSSQPASMRSAPHVVSAMASNEEINHVSPQPALRPAFVVGGRASDQVKTFGPGQGVVRPSGAPMPLPASPPPSSPGSWGEAMSGSIGSSIVPSSDDGIDAQINCHIVARPSGQRGGMTAADRQAMAVFESVINGGPARGGMTEADRQHMAAATVARAEADRQAMAVFESVINGGPARGGMTEADRQAMAAATVARAEAERQGFGFSDEELAKAVIDETLAAVPSKRSGAPAAECGCGPTGARVMQRRAF